MTESLHSKIDSTYHLTLDKGDIFTEKCLTNAVFFGKLYAIIKNKRDKNETF